MYNPKNEKKFKKKCVIPELIKQNMQLGVEQGISRNEIRNVSYIKMFHTLNLKKNFKNT